MPQSTGLYCLHTKPTDKGTDNLVTWHTAKCGKKHTHSKVNKHTPWTHTGAVVAIYAAAPGEQLGVRCLAQGHLSRGIEVERALYIHSPHLQFLPDLRLELAIFQLRVRLFNL